MLFLGTAGVFLGQLFVLSSLDGESSFSELKAPARGPQKADAGHGTQAGSIASPMPFTSTYMGHCWARYYEG